VIWSAAAILHALEPVHSLPRVLIVEDDAAIRGLLVAALGRHALAVEAAADGLAALEKLREGSYAVIIVDLMMPRMDGFALLEAIREMTFAVRPVIFVMSAFDDNALLALDPVLVHGCFKKPFDVEAVVQTIRDCAALMPRAAADTAELDLPHEAPGDTTLGVC
jgi:DNA-binding response OmpR family regulator